MLQDAVVGDARYRPSPVFGVLLAATVIVGVLLWRGEELGGAGVFIFVVLGWILSLTAHEFGHAIVAFFSGDTTVADKGYLTLDVRRYADPTTSLIFPVVILIMGGIGLPGGAVWINNGLIPSATNRSLVSAAGPFASGLFAALCLLPLKFGLFDGANELFIIGLGFLGWIQVIAMLFNLIPMPGLDGYGIIDPHLSESARRAVAPLRRWGIFIIFALFLMPQFSGIRQNFFDLTNWITEALGGDTAFSARAIGWREFRFWENR